MNTWDVRYHADLQRYMLYLPVGRDPVDKAPLVYATPLAPDEALLWQQGEKEELARRLRARGIPLPGPCGIREGKWRRFLKALRRKLLGGPTP
jgi:hypothetical protein